jgi:hypothetical protein
MSVLDLEGNSPLWNALDTGQEEIASILVILAFSEVKKYKN